MKANSWMRPNRVEVRDVPDPQILQPTDAVVRITSTAICGSDLHLLDGYVPTMMRGDILGHEFMGEVVEIGLRGPHARGRRPGGRALSHRVRRLLVMPARALLAVRELQPQRHHGREAVGPQHGRHLRLFALTGGYPGGQAQLARVPWADVNPLKVPDGMPDEQVLFLSDILPTGYMGAEMCDLKGGKVVAVWGAGPVGQFAMTSARLLGAERIIAIDRFPYRLAMAYDKAGATDIINYEEEDVLETLKALTGGRGPDACIDAVGMEAHSPRIDYAYDRAKQAMRLETDRPLALREAIMACRNGGVVSVIGVYGGFVDKFPMGSVMNRSLTIRSGQCHVQRYMRPLLERIQAGELDPSFVITHRMPLSDAPRGYELFEQQAGRTLTAVLQP